MISISDCLKEIQVAIESLQQCATLTQEFNVIKKAYFQRCLVTHPDKGGDEAEFRRLNSCFEIIRGLYDSESVDSFVNLYKSFDPTNISTQSYDFYASAAQELVPTYMVELARSKRSKCIMKKCTAKDIVKGEIRIGSINEISGTYGRWIHLGCWRVPSRIWLGLPDPTTCQDPKLFDEALISMNAVAFCGFSQLAVEERMVLVRYVMDKNNWAKLLKKKIEASAQAEEVKGDDEVQFLGQSSVSIPPTLPKDTFSDAMVPTSGPQRFITPRPGINGAISNCLAGKTVVLTGLFPELGGGAGLKLGKDKARSMVESFGGRCVGSISGKTDILLVGQKPGASKVSKARNMPKIQMMRLDDLKNVIEGKAIANGESKPMVITEFSAGYNNNSKALTASQEEMLIASGLKSPPKAIHDVVSVEKRKSPATTSKTRQKKVKKSNEKFNITCDQCSVDCTHKSWHFEKTTKDYCVDCHLEMGMTGGVLQSGGY